MAKKLFVGNLAFSTTEQYLNDTFAQCGNVESVRIITDRDTGRSKGFAFVEMSTDEEALAAIEKLNDSDHDGRKIAVSEARPQAPRSESRGGGGGSRGPSRGFGGGGGGGGGRGGQSGGGRGGRW